MMRLLFLLVVSIGAFGQSQPGQTMPKAESLFNRYIEVTGGRAIYEMRRTEVSTAKLEMPLQGVTGTMTAYAVAPDKTYTVMEIEGVGKLEAGVANGLAWESSLLAGPRLRDGAERADSIRDATFNAPLQWRKLYQKVETIGIEQVNGEDCFKVEATPPEGAVETTWFSRKSGLIVKRARISRSPMGEVPVEFLTTEYREFNGLLMPTKVVQKAAGAEFVILLDSVRVNEKIAADRFEPPAPVKALIDRLKVEPKQ